MCGEARTAFRIIREKSFISTVADHRFGEFITRVDILCPACGLIGHNRVNGVSPPTLGSVAGCTSSR